MKYLGIKLTTITLKNVNVNDRKPIRKCKEATITNLYKLNKSHRSAYTKFDIQVYPTESIIYENMTTLTIVLHISFAVGILPSDKPKHGKTVTFTFCVSHAPIAKVTGGFPFALLHHRHGPQKTKILSVNTNFKY